VSRPPLEVADVVRAAGPTFITRCVSCFDRQHLKVLNAIQRCRTAALGGHVDECSRCGLQTISYNSCRNRHCPKCQANARHRWLQARRAELLPTRYVHVVFTLPHKLAPLALMNQKVIYDLLFRASSETLLEVARDPRHLGAAIGFFGVLHTWNQKLEHHPHVHYVVSEGGIATDGRRWARPRYNFFLPVKVLGKVFRGKFTDGLRHAFADGRLRFPRRMKPSAHRIFFADLIRQCHRQDWVVYAKRPFGGPEHVLRYLGNYTHRIAISNHRLVGLVERQVSFRWRDSAHKNKKRVMTLRIEEFLRRFFLHVLPRGFVRIRHFGFLANRNRQKQLALCRTLLNDLALLPPYSASTSATHGHDFWRCPACGGTMIIVERFKVAQTYVRPPPQHQEPL
jgi:putative transposase/transposase-like zinc-binding protein